MKMKKPGGAGAVKGKGIGPKAAGPIPKMNAAPLPIPKSDGRNGAGATMYGKPPANTQPMHPERMTGGNPASVPPLRMKPMPVPPMKAGPNMLSKKAMRGGKK